MTERKGCPNGTLRFHSLSGDLLLYVPGLDPTMILGFRVSGHWFCQFPSFLNVTAPPPFPLEKTQEAVLGRHVGTPQGRVGAGGPSTRPGPGRPRDESGPSRSSERAPAAGVGRREGRLHPCRGFGGGPSHRGTWASREGRGPTRPVPSTDLHSESGLRV